jgi:hypothetical protein
LQARPRAIDATIHPTDVTRGTPCISDRLFAAWLRAHAPTLKERTYEHQPTVLPRNRPVGIGQGYSTIALIPSIGGSWALPLRHERITSWDNPIAKATQQLAQVCQHLQHRPIALFDSEYGCAPFVEATSAIEADKLMRIRSNRCLWSAPGLYSGKGRPKIHGNQFKLNDPQSWWKNKPGNPNSQNWELYGSENGITYIFGALRNIR